MSRTPHYREHPELFERASIRCECNPGCDKRIGVKQHFVVVQQLGGASKRVAAEHLGRFEDAAHHPELQPLAVSARGAAAVRSVGRPPATPMPGDDGK
jgi:hypothetical protein